jgi:acetate kinase
MPPSLPGAILAVNAGSSSLKITVFGREAALPRRSAAVVDRIGLAESRLSVTPSNGSTNERVDVPDFNVALRIALDHVQSRYGFTPIAVGHRIVHGGSTHTEHVLVSPALVADLRHLVPLDPTHMPQSLALVDAVTRRYPAVPQFACFDTTFHRTMPRVAQLYPLPRSTWHAGIRRYGFHGLSCESIVTELRTVDASAAEGRLLIAHLGNGASVTAVHHGTSVDTTMGFSPTGGLMMGTRSGDLDPSVVTYLARTGHYTADALERLVTEEAGLLGVSGVSADMRDVLNRTDSREAQDAIGLYCYTAGKHVGALAAVLNGVDTIVFTGGIGEHAPAIRSRICASLDYLGVNIDPSENAVNRPVISRPDSRVTVRVMQTDEDLVIARHVQRLLV